MIGIKVDNGLQGSGFLDLPTNFKIVLTRKSPVYFGGNMDNINGSYSLPVNIKATPNNRQLLSNPEFLNNWDVYEAKNAELHLFGNFFEFGKLSFKTTDKDEYRIQFFSRAGLLADLKEKTLRDYSMPSIFINAINGDFSAGLAAYALQTQTENGHPHVVIPTYVHNWGDDRAEYNILCNYVDVLIRNIFEEEGFSFETGFDNYPELQKLILWWRYYFIHTILIYSNSVPKLNISTFLNSINKLFCMGFDIDSRSKKAKHFFMKDLLNETEFKDYSSRVVSKFTKKEAEYSVKNFEYYVDGTMSHLQNDKFRELTQLPAVDTLDDFPSGQEGDIIFVYKEQKWYLHTGNNGWDEEMPFQDLNALKVAEKGGEIKSNLGAMHIEHFEKLLPSTQREVWFNNPEPDEEDNALLAFYRGIVSTHEGDIPFTTYNSFDHFGNDTWNYSLKWHGEKGLFETWWKPWIDFLNGSAPVEVDMLWQWQDLYEFDFLKPILLWDGHSGGYHRFFVQEQKISVSMKGIEKAKQKLVQVRNI